MMIFCGNITANLHMIASGTGLKHIIANKNAVYTLRRVKPGAAPSTCELPLHKLNAIALMLNECEREQRDLIQSPTLVARQF